MRTDEINVVFLIPMISWMVAQLLKTAIYSFTHKKFNAERIWGAGGMPSSHSALVCSLAMITLRVNGINSTEFALAMALAVIVMYDACGVRHEAGQHAREINRLRRIVGKLDDETIEKLDEEVDIEAGNLTVSSEEKDLKEFLGHTPFQVMCGALLGIIIAIAFPIVVV